MEKENFVIGVDYGTDSVRSLLVDAANGNEIASAIFYYPRWKDGLYCNPAENRFRQHPLDYIEGLESTILYSCLRQAGPAATAKVKSHLHRYHRLYTRGRRRHRHSPGTPPGFRINPNALFILWKDHTAVKEAAEINAHAARFDINYLQFVGGSLFFGMVLGKIASHTSNRRVR